jgi:hypothetical protein
MVAGALADDNGVAQSVGDVGNARCAVAPKHTDAGAA